MPPSRPTEPPDPATMTPTELCDRLEDYKFECPGGTLKNCDEWIELRRCLGAPSARWHHRALLLMTLVAAFALVPAADAAYGQPSPVPSGPGGSCPYGWAAVGSYCQPPQGAQGAVPIAPGGGCPSWLGGGRLVLRAAEGCAGRGPPSARRRLSPGWAGVGSYCQRPQGAQDAVPRSAQRQLSSRLGGERLLLHAPRQFAAVAYSPETNAERGQLTLLEFGDDGLLGCI